jgi:hypothetical protein
MYKIDKLIDLTPLVGNEVIQICIGLYSVGIGFINNEVSINISGQYKLEKNGSVFLNGCAEEDPDINKMLVCLLHQSIESAMVVADNILVVNFSNDYCLHLIDDSEQYESFIVRCQTFELIV